MFMIQFPMPAPPKALFFSAEGIPFFCLESSLTPFFLNFQNITRVRLLLTFSHYYWIQTVIISCTDYPTASSGASLLLSLSLPNLFSTEKPERLC